MASKVLSGVIKTTQRQNIIPLKVILWSSLGLLKLLIPLQQNRFVTLAKKTRLPSRRDPEYATSLRTLHSAILGLCSLIESYPYSVEPWLPPLTEGKSASITRPPCQIVLTKIDCVTQCWHHTPLIHHLSPPLSVTAPPNSRRFVNGWDSNLPFFFLADIVCLAIFQTHQVNTP